METKKSDELPEALVLNKIVGYEVWVSNESVTQLDRCGSDYTSLLGVYKNESIAEIDAKGKSAWGGNGTVKKAVFFTDKNTAPFGAQFATEGAIYNRVEKIGKFTDENRKYREEIMENIKSKLSPEEIKLLGI